MASTSVPAQVISAPVAPVLSGLNAYHQATPLTQIGVILITVLVGLFLYGRWTGQSFSWNLLAPNALGTTLEQAHQQAQAAAQKGGPTKSPSTPPATNWQNVADTQRNAAGTGRSSGTQVLP